MDSLREDASHCTMPGDTPKTRRVLIHLLAPLLDRSNPTLAPHTERGRPTWYTDSAGSMLRFILASRLGPRVEANRLRILLCVPEHRASFRLNDRYRETLGRIEVRTRSPDDVGDALAPVGTALSCPDIPLVDDRRKHAVVVRTHPTAST